MLEQLMNNSMTPERDQQKILGYVPNYEEIENLINENSPTHFDEEGIPLKKAKSSPQAGSHKKQKKRHSSNKEAASKDGKHLKKKTTAKSGHS